MEPNALKPGDELAGYRIEAVERREAGCVVLLARDPERARAVTLHVARQEPGSVGAVRFAERARRLSAVRHPHLLQVYEAQPFGAVGAAPRGRRLDRILADGALPAEEAVRLTRELALAVEALVGAGAEVPELTPERIWDGPGGAQLDALETATTIPGEDRAPSAAAALVRLLALAAGAAPPELVHVVERANDGAYLSAGRLAEDLVLPRRRRWFRLH